MTQNGQALKSKCKTKNNIKNRKNFYGFLFYP